jgi:hypothetical protein
MRFLLLIIVIAFTWPQAAHATRTVTSPWVDEGVLKLKSKTGITHDDESESRDGALQQNFAAEYGLTERFSLEAEGIIENPGDEDDTSIAAAQLKGKLQFTEKGKHWIDSGARLTYEQGYDDNPDANLIFSQETGEDADDEAEAGFSWSSRYKMSPAFEPGVEIYSNIGRTSDRPDFEDQDHSIGPVAYGKLGSNFKYEAGYLAGITENAADERFKAILEYAVKF